MNMKPFKILGAASDIMEEKRFGKFVVQKRQLRQL